METHQIRYFLAVCDQHNFTRAAQLSYVSQPSLTQAIKKLEEELGGELFIRERSGCFLTPLGRIVEPKLRKIYKEIVGTKADAIRFCRLNTIPIRIGLMATIGAQKLSVSFAAFQQAYPNIELELIIDSESALLHQLDNRVLDVVISAPIQLLAMPYQSTLLYQEHYVVTFSPEHAFNQLEQINLKALQNEAYLDRLNCELREKLRSICRDRDINLYATYRSNNEEWILQMVRAGLGVALMPEYSLPLKAQDISARPLIDPEISRQVYSIHVEQHRIKPELQALLSRLQ